MKKTLLAFSFLTVFSFGVPVFAAEPSLHQVYQAADTGRLNDAQQMMREVLQAHPNSGKAHYVEAELLAKQGQLKLAENELATAEKLAPGLPFATPQAVSGLRNLIGHHSAGAVSQVQQMPVPEQSAAHVPGLPWGSIFMVLGLIACIVWVAKFMARRNPPGGSGMENNWQAGSAAYRPASYSATPYAASPQGYSAAGPGPVVAGQGLGSQVLGGLATGAAVGAGVVAGEALMHHFMDGRGSSSTRDQGFAYHDAISSQPSLAVDDMGGNDFGIVDGGSWDDSSSGGDSDWN